MSWAPNPGGRTKQKAWLPGTSATGHQDRGGRGDGEHGQPGSSSQGGDGQRAGARLEKDGRGATTQGGAAALDEPAGGRAGQRAAGAKHDRLANGAGCLDHTDRRNHKGTLTGRAKLGEHTQGARDTKQRLDDKRVSANTAADVDDGAGSSSGGANAGDLARGAGLEGARAAKEHGPRGGETGDGVGGCVS